MHINLAQFVRSCSAAALGGGDNDRFFHVTLYARLSGMEDRAVNRHIHLVTYRYKTLFALYVAEFPIYTALDQVRPCDWRPFGPYQGLEALKLGAEQAMLSVMTSMREQLPDLASGNFEFNLPAHPAPHTFQGVPMNLELPESVALKPSFLCSALA